MSLRFIAQTADGAYTPSFTAELFVLENPCVYGHCSHVTLGTIGCNNIQRSMSFENYFCVCDAGYEGEWCHIETNECQTAPCALMFDCEDLVNSYQCNINISKLMAILMCSLIAIAGTVFLIFKISKRMKTYRVLGKITPSMENMRESSSYKNETYVLRHTDLERPTTAGSIQIEPSTSRMPEPDRNVPEADDVDVTSFITTAGMKAPPHHSKPKTVLVSEQIPDSTKTVCSKVERFNVDSLRKSMSEEKAPIDSDNMKNSPIGSAADLGEVQV